MNRFFKVTALVMTFGLIISSPVFADTTWFTDVSVDILPSGEGSLTVTIMNGASIGFPAASATLANPWVASSQYLRVQYSATYNSTWGVRIVTDNKELVGGDISKIGPAYDDAAKTKTSYSGLLNNAELSKPAASQDTSKRAAWAWQVYANPLGDPLTVPSSTVAVKNSGTELLDKQTPEANADSVGKWNSAWAYIADKSNNTFNSAILEDGDGDGTVDDLTYAMVLVGPSGGGGGALAQHPQKAIDAGDGDIAMYLASRFANTNWGDVNKPFAYVLSAGSYKAKLYLELIHE